MSEFSHILLIGSLNNVAIKLDVMRLLLFFSSFPGTVAQVTASCIAQCSQKCKELKIVADGEKIGKDKHKKIEREMKMVRGTKGQLSYLKSMSYSILRKVTDCLFNPIFVCPHNTAHAYSKTNGASENCHILKINCILQLVSSCVSVHMTHKMCHKLYV